MGGVVATAAWVQGSAAYAFYIENFANYNEVYGSLGAVVGFLIWLWLSNLAMLFGGELNAEIDRRGQTAY
jgi:membrane protein